MTNYDRIRAMSVEEIVKILRGKCDDCTGKTCDVPCWKVDHVFGKAADLIESQLREINRLTEISESNGQAIGLLTSDYETRIRNMAADAANYQQVKSILSREGFSDIETMIIRYKQVMHDANEISIARDEELESLRVQLAESRARERNARNELCQKCGRYREAHSGACDGCKWKELSL